MTRSIIAVLPAAGVGSRMQADKPETIFNAAWQNTA